MESKDDELYTLACQIALALKLEQGTTISSKALSQEARSSNPVITTPDGFTLTVGLVDQER